MSKHILLIITGSIAAYKTIDLAREMLAAGYVVSIILSHGAEQFITPISLEAFAGLKVYSDSMWSEDQHPMLHIELARAAQAIIIAPASASYLAKMAAGMADSLSLAILLASEAPVAIAPAMNPYMYANPATTANLATLAGRGVSQLGPIHGQVACLEIGDGKYVGNAAIVEYAHSLFKSGRLQGKTAVVNLGSTREYFDPVRYISNVSSGAQGVAIALALAAEGCQVHMLAGDVSVALPTNIPFTLAYTAAEMLAASEQLLPVDIYVGVAAICDFRPKNYVAEKIKKSVANLSIELVPNLDVITTIASAGKRPQLVLGFALESSDGIAHAKDKLARKKLDMIVLNHTTEQALERKDFTIITSKEEHSIPAASKDELARALVDYLAKLIR